MRRLRHLLMTVAIISLPLVAQATHTPNLVVQQTELISPFVVEVSGTIDCVESGFYGVSATIFQRGGPQGQRQGNGGFSDSCPSAGPTCGYSMWSAGHLTAVQRRCSPPGAYVTPPTALARTMREQFV
jgi:hypothetical protein